MDPKVQVKIMDDALILRESVELLEFSNGAQDFSQMFESIQTIRNASTSALQRIREQFNHIDVPSEM